MPLPPLYDPDAVRPMWEELSDCRVMPLHHPEDVDEMLAKPGTALMVVNSVCGCAAGSARPGVTMALQHTARFRTRWGRSSPGWTAMRPTAPAAT